jgi:hypothetical protein
MFFSQNKSTSVLTIQQCFYIQPNMTSLFLSVNERGLSIVDAGAVAWNGSRTINIVISNYRRLMIVL